MASFLSQIAKITDNLYLSSFVGATEFNLIKYNIKCVISVCKEVPKIEHKHVESIKLDVVDKPTESLIRYFDLVADKIKEVTDRNGICLVHCVAGVSRSATMVLVYLMKHHKMPLKDAHTLVKSRRPFIRPNLGFWKQMVDYELKLFGKNSVHIVPSNIGFIPDIYENEVKSMVWAKNNSQVNGGHFGYNPNNTRKQAAVEIGVKAKAQDINYNNNNNHHHHTGHSTEHHTLPIMNNPMPKFSPNIATKIPVSNSMPVKSQSNSNSVYTTTYRSSYQKP